MYYSYKYARAGTPFWRQKVEPVFRLTGSSAASHLSALMSFDYTEQGSNYWFSVLAWLSDESDRKITDCPILWKDKTAAYLLCVMLIITENMTKHYPSEIILPDTRAQKPPRVMPRIRDSKGFWPDDSIVCKTEGATLRKRSTPVWQASFAELSSGVDTMVSNTMVVDDVDSE